MLGGEGRPVKDAISRNRGSASQVPIGLVAYEYDNLALSKRAGLTRVGITARISDRSQVGLDHKSVWIISCALAAAGRWTHIPVIDSADGSAGSGDLEGASGNFWMTPRGEHHLVAMGI